jgi:hypothetical protein
LACGALFRASIKCLVKLLNMKCCFLLLFFFLVYQCFDSVLSKFRDSEVESLNFGFCFCGYQFKFRLQPQVHDYFMIQEVKFNFLWVSLWLLSV